MHFGQKYTQSYHDIVYVQHGYQESDHEPIRVRGHGEEYGLYGAVEGHQEDYLHWRQLHHKATMHMNFMILYQ